MRFVPINCIREGMIAARQLFGKNGELLLNSGAFIRTAYIETIKNLGYNGIYIDDELSRDIQIEELIDENLKFKTVQTLKSTFSGIDGTKGMNSELFSNLSELMNNILDDLLSTRDLMVNMIDIKVFDDYSFYHSVNVMVLSLVMGISLGFNKGQLFKLGLAALLHDIGKVFIPKEIIKKPSKLDSWEYNLVKTHSFKGYEYLKEKTLIPVASYVGILHHHEAYNGSGYPLKVEGAKISLFGRIIAIADVYDALTSDRPYRKAMIPSEAVEYLMGGGGTLFDPELINVFIKKIAPYPVGTCVTLSDDSVALVVQNYSDCCMRPKVKVVKRAGKPSEPFYIDLRDDASARKLTITGVAQVV